jgi:ABC-type dipeptide/oligopeptide/nickel transport system permease component/ABC-type transport system substrate-binding protein
LTLRTFSIGVPLACVLFALLLVGAGAALRPAPSAVPRMPSEQELAAAQKARDVSFDASHPDSLPRFERPIVPEQALDAPWWPEGESPILAQLVAEGKLPPVAQRVGPEPVVLDGATGAQPEGTSLGKYGGTWRQVVTSADEVSSIELGMGYSGLFRWSPLGDPIVPHLALSFDESPDRREYVVHLRPGVRWSDGFPFGADDILFWWKYQQLDTALGDGAPPIWLRSGKGQTRLEQLDELTFKVSFDEPFGNFLEVMAANSFLMTRFPKHYFEKYQPALADSEFLAAELKAFGSTDPRSLWREHLMRWDNPECPRLWPWIPRSASTSPPFLYMRNPYYFAVDPQGNQLPYIDRIQFDLKASEALPLTFTSGELTLQGRHFSPESYTELMSRQQEGHYRLLHWYSAARSTWVINPNLTRYIDPLEPATAKKAKLLADPRFRQALSLAIDRPAIVRAHFDGTVRASQLEPGGPSPFHSERLANAFIDHDPARANALLEELGLSQRDLDGMRTFADGSTMTFFLTFTADPGRGPAELVLDDWREVGVRVIAREQSQALFQQQRDSSDFDLMVGISDGDHFPLLDSRSFAPQDSEALYASAWGRWFARGGYFGSPRALEQKNAYAPPLDHPMYAAYRALVEARQLGTLDERVARFREATDIAAENLWTINIAQAPPFLVVAKEGLRNVPTKAMYTARTPANAGAETYYFEEPSHAADAATRDAIEHLTPLPRPGELAPSAAVAAPRNPNRELGEIVRWSLLGIAAAFLLLVSLRHPYITRRILVLVPALAIVSLVVFAASDQPPGNYLSARVVALSERGDSDALAQLDELRQRFHFDEPAWKRYLRWVGVNWFTTHDDEDRGLLQGSLGRSLETGRSINELVGDRIVLTVAIAIASVLLAGLVALPIGIYSAVRRNSLGDHLLGLLAFVALSVPPFLLALLLLLRGGVPGSFSPGLAAQPGWTLPSAIELLKHVWIPALLIGASGAAALARLLRTQLLAELSQPYVTAARARGVQRLKLLFRYPLRVALSPFVSGIGALFPHLISAGAIVAIVLGLPSVGPLQLGALLNEDTHLAGAMLMVLSLLSVFGTLLADLLQLWLDPRIRHQKGPA